MLEGNEPTKTGKEFYYYSTNSADNEQGQNGVRYDLGYWYDVPNTAGTTMLYAIYLTPSSNYQTAQNYVVVPKNVTEIANASVNMFGATNNSVKFVTLPRTTTKIGNNAFANCSGLVGVSMSDFVTSIGENAFKSDSALTKFRAPSSLQTLGKAAFSGCSTLSKIENLESTEITEIQNDSFANCQKLESIVLPSNLLLIGEGVFAGSGLKTINLEETKLQSLGASAFNGCSDLKYVTMPSTLNYLGQAVFMFSGVTEVKNFAGTLVSKIEKWTFWFSGLTKIELPETLESIEETSFASCTELTQVGGLQNTKVSSIANSAFSGCSKLKNVIFPQTLLTLGSSAFSGCTALVNVSFNSNLTSVGASCFEGCSALSKLTGLESTAVTAIGDNAFKDCSSLVDISLPSTIQTIGANAFANCSSLATINFINDSNLSTLSVTSNSFTGTTSDLKVNILDEEHFDQYISKLNGKGFAENAFMFFLGNIDRKAYYKNGIWEKFRDAVITSSSGEHGTISPSGSVVYSLGSSANYVISPETGYRIKEILVDGVSISITAADGASQNYQFDDIQKDHTISATFEQRMFKISVYCGENGKIDPGYNDDYAYGSSVNFVITPDNGYSIKEVLIDGAPSTKAKENGQYTFANIRANHDIEVSFENVTFTIISSVGEGGTMSPNQTTTTKNWGEDYEITFTPNAKYVISAIIVDGERVGLSGVDLTKAYTYTFSKIVANHIISCRFETTQRILTYDANGGVFDDGTISKTQEYNAFIKDSITLVSPNPTREGYEFSNWNKNPEGSGEQILNGDIYSDVFGQEDGWLYAIWKPIKYSITATADAHGTISPSGEVEVEWGSTTTFEMKPDDGYRVSSYSIDGGNAISSTVQAGNSDYYTFSKISSNHTIRVSFAPITYTVKYNGNGATSGSTASSTHTYDVAQSLTANGFSRTGYTFAGWATTAGGTTSYTNKQSVKNLSSTQGATVNLYAVWTANTYTVTFNPSGGSVSPTTKTVTYDSTYGALPTPTRSGYTFGGWTGSKNLVNNNIKQYGWGGNSTTVDANTGKYTFRTTPGSGTGSAWRSFYVDVSAYVGKKVSISGKISAVSPSGATLSYIKVGQANSGDYPYHIAGSSDSKTISNSGSFSHTCTIISGTSIMGICIWMNATSAGGYVDVTVENLQVEVSDVATSFENPNKTITSSTIVNTASDHTLTAIWTPNTYSITFNAGEASICEKYWNYAGSTGYTSSNAGSYSKYSFEDSRKSPVYANAVYDKALSVYTPIPQRLGYKFDGWYSAKSGGVKVADANGSLVASAGIYTGANKQWQNANNTVLYARWTANSYAVEYTLNGGTKGSTSPTSYTFGTNTTISDPTRNGYTFAGWSVTATLDDKKNGTINKDTGILQYGSNYPNAVYFPLFYQKAGVAYTGKLGNNEIRWRQWHETGGGYFGNASDSATFATSEARLLSLWYHLGMSGDTTTLSWAGGKSFKIDANQVGKLTLTANWTTNTYTVTANANGGTIPTTSGWTIASGSKTATKTVTFDATYGTLPTPTRTGYTFAGWWTTASGGTQVTNSTKVTTASNHSIYAHWTANKYTVTFDPNNKGGLISTQTSDGTYSGNNMTLYYTASSHEYRLVNVTSNDPFAQIGQTVYLTANTTYLMHAEVYNSSWSVIPASSGSIQIFYAIGGAYSEANSRRFYANTTYQTFTVPTTGTYNIRIDNDCGQTVRIQKFWIYRNFTYQKTVTYGEAYGTLPTGLQASAGSFVKWNSSTSGGSTVSSSTIVTTASNHTVYGSWSGLLTITVNSSSYYSNVKYSTSSGQSGSIANGSSVNLANVPSTDTVTITATAKGMYINCSSAENVYYGFRLNGSSSYSAYNTSSSSSTISRSISVRSLTQITVSAYVKYESMCCVTGDSLITMADGSTKQIKDIVAGDKIMSYNFETKQMEPTTVEVLTKIHRTQIVHVKFADGTMLKITPDHPMFSERGWICYDPDAGKTHYFEVGIEEQGTQIGDMLLSLSLMFDKEIVDIEYFDNTDIDVYTLTAAGNHNYFVQSVLVHNKPCAIICCVDGETNITMANGSFKKAKDITEGDEVLSFNQETGEFEKTTIEEVITPYRQNILEIEFEDGTTIKITDDHPMLSERGWICYNPQRGQMAYGKYGVSDEAIHVGDKIFTQNGTKTISSIKVIKFEESQMVYTFKLANGKTFIANGNIVASTIEE